MEPNEPSWLDVVQQATRVAKEYNIPASVMIAQAALESAYGASAPGYNYFGIKGRGTSGSQRLRTTEVYQGKPVQIYDDFAAYKSPADSFRAYAQLITENPTYKSALQYRNDPEKFTQAIAQSGYATDPQYAQKVMNIQSNYKYLDQALPQLSSTPNQPTWLNNLTSKLFSVGASPAYAATPSAQYKPVTQPNPYFGSGLPTGTSQYTVKPGDTLWGIAENMLGSGARWKELQGYLGDPRQLPIGTRISTPKTVSSGYAGGGWGGGGGGSW